MDIRPWTGIFLPPSSYDLPLTDAKIPQEVKDYFELAGFSIGNMTQLGYPNLEADPESYFQSYSIFYNCIGFAFNLGNEFISCEFDDGKTVQEEDLRHFCEYLFAEHDKNNSSKILCRFEAGQANLAHYAENHEFQEDDVIFYFQLNKMVHVARFFNIYLPKNPICEELRWVSKLGEDLLVSHRIADLGGEIYGEPRWMLVRTV